MSVVTVGRWGKSLAVRLPAEVASRAGINDGARVQVVAQEGAIIIRRAAPEPTLEEMFVGQTADAWRAEYAGAFNWDQEVGREVVTEETGNEDC